MQNTTNVNTAKTVTIFTDGSCNVHGDNKAGGWGVTIASNFTTKVKELAGNSFHTTVNIMELEAMKQALINVNTDNSGIEFEFYTDSKYVIQSLMNKNKNQSNNCSKAKNPERLQELYSVVDSKGLEVTFMIGAVKDLKDGDTAIVYNDNVHIKYVKGHNNNGGNDRADQLAVGARKHAETNGSTRTWCTVKGVETTSVKAEERNPESSSADPKEGSYQATKRVEKVEKEITTMSKEEFKEELDSLEDDSKTVPYELQEEDRPNNRDIWVSKCQESAHLTEGCQVLGFDKQQVIDDLDCFKALVSVLEDYEKEGQASMYWADPVKQLSRWIPSLEIESGALETEEVVDQVVEEDLEEDCQLITTSRIINCKTNAELFSIIQASDILEQGGTASEEFSFTTDILLEDEVVYQLHTDSNLNLEGQAYNVKKALEVLIPYLVQEGCIINDMATEVVDVCGEPVEYSKELDGYVLEDNTVVSRPVVERLVASVDSCEEESSSADL